MIYLKKVKTLFIYLILFSCLCLHIGCATNSKNIAISMLAGGAVGAGIGGGILNQGANQQKKERNMITSSIFFAILAGSTMAWHYNTIEKVKEEISGRYARYRLCDPEKLNNEFLNGLNVNNTNNASSSEIYSIDKNQIGKLSITLDDHIKWVYPTFRKRYLQPEKEETQVISKRYIWEILRSGRFVTRSQNPYYFVGAEDNDDASGNDDEDDEISFDDFK